MSFWKLIAVLIAGILSSLLVNAQVQNFSFTGAPQSFTVPPCVNQVTIVANGAQGGCPNGGAGAQVTHTISVCPGDVIQVNVGGQGGQNQAGYNGGGVGGTANMVDNFACGGGGSTNISLNGSPIIIAAGGGGQGGGNTNAQGGTGGCDFGGGGISPFGQGGGGATSTSEGMGGPPWIASGFPGGNGQQGQGGTGATDPCFDLGPGGGGGGGLFGGGGGGSDCFGSGSLGGGGGGGGSSLVPNGGNCVAGSNFGNGSATISWSASNIPPSGTAPASITVNCPLDVPFANINSVVVNPGLCGSIPVVTFLGDSYAGSCPLIITRTYRLTNSCGLITDLVQTITINDQIPPIGTAPAPISVACFSQVPLPNTSLVTNLFDNCGTPSVIFLNDNQSGTCPVNIIRTYRISDACGNQTDVTQTITVNDNVPPTGIAPPSSTLICIDDLPAPDVNLVTNLADNCGTPTVQFLSDAQAGSCPTVVTRTYRITDDCGNFTDLTQFFEINDNIAPSGTAPVGISVTCIAEVPAPDVSLVTNLQDNCGDPTVIFLSDAQSGTCPTTVTRTYRITDACGNFSDVTQAIVVNDNVPPTGTAPTAITVACISEIPAPNVNLVTNTSDNCGGGVVVTHFGDQSAGTCPIAIVRTYRITDVCGNFTDVFQNITVNDNVPPTATAPANLSVFCVSDVPAPNISAVTNVADNCGNATVAFVSDVSDNNTCNGEIITRTYSVTDDCGNATILTQEITVTAIPPSPNFFGTNPSTCGGTDGTILISGLIDGVNYSVSYNGQQANNFSANSNGQILIENLGAGVYQDFVISNLACLNCPFNAPDVIGLFTPPLPNISAGQNQAICIGGQVTLTAINPDGALISWNQGVEDGVPFTPEIGTTTYTVTANLNDCIATSQVSVTVHPLPNIGAGNDAELCIGSSFVLNGTGGVSYVWEDGYSNGQSVSPPIGVHTYSVVGTDANGCQNTAQVTVTVVDFPNISFTANPLEVEPNQIVTFTNTSAPGTTNFVWNFGNGQLASNAGQVTNSYENPGLYDVTLVGDLNGCPNNASGQILVTNYGPPEIIVPNVFSPNGDGINDVWFFVSLTKAASLELEIVNRWGNLIFESSDLNTTWDGKDLSGSDLAEGVYFYKYVVIGLNGETYEGHGNITLVRK